MILAVSLATTAAAFLAVVKPFLGSGRGLHDGEF